ncbi:MAG TPA: bifunctional pyr operon transcriptional regulator/uracil phosphoribosyltransferase PyrR [Opitutus sp.]|nr:bifunctional pyr operon transcriptional regulator/uracil phosphoribosyltransferase PyrR [Opitutus sp.]
MAQPKTIGATEINAAIDRLATAIAASHGSGSKLLLLGIANGGVELARRLSARLSSLRPPLAAKPGTLDISFHRDDIARHPIPKEFAPTFIPGDVNGSTVVMVDDVLFSGRTIKAALDELFDHGRPSKVELAILVDRGGRRLPFKPDYCGFTVETGESEKVTVRLDPADQTRDEIRIAPAPAGQKSAL